MATFVTQTVEGPTCPICLGLFNLPRQLPCAHSFCQSCLQSYITSKATEHEKNKYIECPVCRQKSGHIKQNKSVNEWANLFPADTVLQSMLPTNSKVDRLCDACISEGVSITATGFCAVCEEAMCDTCLSFHRKQKMLKNHTILTTEDLQNNVHHVMKFAEGFTCFEHEDEDLKFYCNNHKIACCGMCYFESHKTCPNVKKLNEELTVLLQETKSSQTIEELKKLETHLKTIIDVKESNVNELECQVNGLRDQIREMRKKINSALDELEIKITTEGRKIHKDVSIRTQEENHQCLSLIHAIKNSQILCEIIHKHGLDIQKFLTAEKIKSQLSLYHSQVREKYERIDKLTLHVKFTPLIESVVSLSSSDVGKLVTMTGSDFSIPSLRKPTRKCQFEKVKTFEVNISGVQPWFSGVTFLPIDRVMLVYHDTNQCILLNNLHQVVTTYKLTGKPYDICVVGDDEVAVSMWYPTNIEILSVRDDVISPVKTITTKYQCKGITSAGNGEMFVVGDCGNNKSCVSLIRDGHDDRYFDQFDSPPSNKYIALNKSKTQVYVTVCENNSLHCFSMQGKMQYTYRADNLKGPSGVAVDRDDNVYVVGYNSHNIHRLSPEGSLIQIFTAGLPKSPRAISFDNSSDTCIITNYTYSERNQLHIYQLK